jgi:hypothetical protein
MTFYKKCTAEAVRFLSYIPVDKKAVPWYNFKDKYSGSPHPVLPLSGRTFF